MLPACCHFWKVSNFVRGDPGSAGSPLGERSRDPRPAAMVTGAGCHGDGRRAGTTWGVRTHRRQRGPTLPIHPGSPQATCVPGWKKPSKGNTVPKWKRSSKSARSTRTRPPSRGVQKLEPWKTRVPTGVVPERRLELRRVRIKHNFFTNTFGLGGRGASPTRTLKSKCNTRSFL